MKDDSAAAHSKVAAYRASQPFGWDYREWTTRNGGHVTQLGQMRCFSKVCECGAPVTKRVYIGDCYERCRGYGNWPTLCRECSERRQRERDAAAKDRMRRKRASERAIRDEAYRQRGWTLPKPRGRNAKRDPGH